MENISMLLDYTAFFLFNGNTSRCYWFENSKIEDFFFLI